MPFSSLPPELRLKIWESCLPGRPRQILLATTLQVAITTHTSRPAQESIVIGGSFAAGQAPSSSPVFPLPLRGLVEALGAVCHESRSVALEHYPDVIRIGRRSSSPAEGGTEHDRSEELLLRCSFRADLFELHSLEIGWWYFADHKGFALSVHESVRSSDRGAERADEFRAALRGIRHLLLVSFEGALWARWQNHWTPWCYDALPDFFRENRLNRYRHLLFGMRLLESLTLLDLTLLGLTLSDLGKDPFDRLRQPLSVESLPRDSVADRVKQLYEEYRHRFVSPAYYSTSIADMSNLVEHVMREQPDQDSKEFDELLGKRLKQMGFDNHSEVIKELEVKPGPRKEGQEDQDTLVLPEFFQIVKLD
ncbi:hypothetical protein ACJ41O_011741 [Fusarium nematophilum]